MAMRWWTLAWWSGLTMAVLPHTPSSSNSAGRWCPRVSRRLVACVQPKWTWSPDGRRLYQQRKRVYRWKEDVQWSCCPGFQGDNCDQQCLHCTMIHDIITRLESAEAIVNSMQYKDGAVKSAAPVNASQCLCPPGPKGDRGPQGPPGAPGPSASVSQGKLKSQGPRGQRDRKGPKGDTGERGPRRPRGKRGPRGKPSKAEVEREQEQEKRLTVLEARVQELEGEVAEMQALLNVSNTLSEQFDLLQKKVLHLQDTFLHGSGKTDATPLHNSTQRKVGEPATLMQRHQHQQQQQQQQQAEDPDIAPLSAREFRASQTLTASHGPHNTKVQCACKFHGPPPPPPPLPLEILQALFPGQNVSHQLLSSPGFCRQFREQLKDLFRKNFAPHIQNPDKVSTPETSSARSPHVPDAGSSESPVSSKQKENSQTALYTSATSPPRTRKTKIIDLMKNWKSLTGTGPVSKPPDTQGTEDPPEEKEIVGQFSKQLGKPVSASRSFRTVAGMFVCLSNVVISILSLRVVCLSN